MNRNQLKLYACAAMLIDHIGYFIFPQLTILRYIGRTAMPIFAFFIGEGCLHTSNRKKYFLSLFILASGCQAVYIAEELILTGRLSLKSECWYFNILFTFAFSALAGFLLTDIVKAFREKKSYGRPLCVFIIYTVFYAGMTFFLWNVRKSGYDISFDYGICGFLLPLAAIPFKSKKAKTAAFAVMLAVYCLVYMGQMPYVWFAFCTVPLLILYNGKAGSRKFKYFFYIFYPAHLGAVYLAAMLIYST